MPEMEKGGPSRGRPLDVSAMWDSAKRKKSEHPVKPQKDSGECHCSV